MAEEGLLAAANRKLKNHRVSLKVVGGRLWIQGRFPPKPGSVKTKWHQQSISARQPFTSSGIKAALMVAKRIDAQLVEGTFDWKDWSNLQQKAARDYTAGDWIDAFRADWESRRTHAPRTWRKEYGIVFEHLDRDRPLDELQVMRALRES